MEAGMLGSMQLQPHRRAGLALASAVWLLLSSLLALQHIASVGHVVDRTTGKVHHGERLIGRHVGGSDYHPASRTHRADDECSIATTLGQAARAPVQDTAIASAALPAIAVFTHRELHAQLIYRFAPKTSPPSARAHV